MATRTWRRSFWPNGDQTKLELAPIESITFDSLFKNRYAGMEANRDTWDYVTCYVAGTLLATADGPRAIETLVPGDLVMTMDHGLQPVRWIGRSTCTVSDRLAPVRIAAGALGHGLPRRDLFVSQQHRMLVRSRIAERMTGRSEILIPPRS